MSWDEHWAASPSCDISCEEQNKLQNLEDAQVKQKLTWQPGIVKFHDIGDAVVDILEGQNVRFHLFLDTKVSLAPTRMSVRKLVGWSVVLSNCGVKIVPAAYIASHCWSQKGKTTLYFLKVYFLKV